jgi:general secretion pathway protein A
MYLTYYGFKREPFHITPDPEFLYLSHSHREALASIIYGIEQKKGFITITGSIGVGKTTILRSYLDSAKKDSLKIVYVFNSRLSFEELLKTICKDLGISVPSNTSAEIVNELYVALIEEYKKGNTVVLVVDEAQNMPVETLENLRMISNLETSTDKLIQIVLVGQPEFDEILSTNRLNQLKQRMAVRSTILPFTIAESLDYMKYRIIRAGGDPLSIFTLRALKKIAKKSKGIPRTINIWCDNALINGFGKEQKPVKPNTVQDIIHEFSGQPRKFYLKLATNKVLVVLLLFAAAAILFSVFYPSKWLEYWGQIKGFSKQEQSQTKGIPVTQSAFSGQAVKEAHGNSVLNKTVDKASSGFLTDDQIAAAKTIRRTVIDGDTLFGLVREIYQLEERDSRAGKLVKIVKAKNDQITDTNKIVAGQVILFPDVKKSQLK